MVAVGSPMTSRSRRCTRICARCASPTAPTRCTSARSPAVRFLVTGANSGIGKGTVRVLALRGGRVFLACRSQESGRRALEEIAGQTGNRSLELLLLDLGDLESVRGCADTFLARHEPLH